MRSRLAAGVGAGILFAATLSGWIAALIFDSPPLASAADVTWALSFLAFPTVGLLLAVRRPRNPIGWMFIVGPGMIGHAVAQMEVGSTAVGDNLFGLGVLVLLASLLLFPDGDYPGRLWKWAHFGVLGGIAIEQLVLPESDGGLSVAAAFLLTTGSLIYRLARGDATSRRQLALPVLVGISGAAGATIGGLLTNSDWTGVAWMCVMTVGIPVAIAVAILRYRLFDIDRIVSRGVTYLLVATVVVGIYAIPVLTAPRLMGQSSDLVIAASTLTAAAVFNPARRRIQHLVDRRFNRARFDAEREIEGLATAVGSAMTLAAVEENTTRVIRRTVQPSQVSLWVRSHR